MKLPNGYILQTCLSSVYHHLAIMTILSTFILFATVASGAVATPDHRNYCIYFDSKSMPCEYGTTDCPPKNVLKPDGLNCQDNSFSPTQCISFCEIRTNYLYGREQPLIRSPFCRGPELCMIPNGVHQAYKYTGPGEGRSDIFEIYPTLGVCRFPSYMAHL
jgi:hypothetical protein